MICNPALTSRAGDRAIRSFVMGRCCILLGFVLLLPRAGGAQTFEEIARSAGIKHYCHDPNRIGGGVAFFDYNNDGLEDLVVTNGFVTHEDTGDL